MLSHEEHLSQISVLAEECGTKWRGRTLLDDNMPMIVSDVLGCYSPFQNDDRPYPDEWYIIGVTMYALGEKSRKRLPVDLISLGTFVKRVCDLGKGATRERILAVADYFALELFQNGNDDKERIAAVLHDYVLVAYGDQL